MKLKLKEVLWEVTNKCNRSCSFCGSKEIINCDDDSTVEQKYAIAESIGRAADVVTLTGGEPLTLDEQVLSSIVQILKSHSCEVDLVTNGDLLQDWHFDLFRNIGISVNSTEDATKLPQSIHEKSVLGGNIVFITNVNKINFFDLDDIFKAASDMAVGVQVQLTMYKEDDNSSMLSLQGITDLRDKIAALSVKHIVQFVLADNLQVTHECSAGISSCGVLYNGDVVPCLSERAWKSEMSVQGNVLITSLKDVWINGFADQRFCDDCKCCHDCIMYPEYTLPLVNDNDSDVIDWNKSARPIDKSRTLLYGVTIPGRTGNHAPYYPPNDVMLYGVYPPDSTIGE
jgi:MoaA/NifB/PqqE/SkfB family radical SAM enzyme